jgi:hypothetical protein
MALPFKVNKETKYIDVRDIKPALPRQYLNFINSMHIQDCFLDQDDKILYLLSHNDQLFWLEEKSIPHNKLQDFLSSWRNSNDERTLAETTCRVNKEYDIPCNKKTRTKGNLLAVYNCGIIAGYTEIFLGESLTQVSIFLLQLLDEIPKYIIYDNACHLEPFVKKHQNLNSAQLLKLNDTIFVIDRLHFFNHVGKNCKNYKAENHDELKNVNTVICEETNYWFSGYKHIMKYMNSERYLFYLYIICESYNNEKIKLNRIKKFKD